MAQNTASARVTSSQRLGDTVWGRMPRVVSTGRRALLCLLSGFDALLKLISPLLS